MRKVLNKSLDIYRNTAKLSLGFGTLVILALLLMPLLSSYVDVGGGFIRFSSLYNSDISYYQLAIVGIVGFVSIALISLFLAAQISIVKLTETLDQIGFTKVMAVFPRYVLKIFLFLLMLSMISVGVGTGLDYLGVHHAFVQLILFALWLPFVFAPQILVLEDFGVAGAIRDSIQFITNSPLSLAAFLVFGTVIIFALTLLEAGLGQFFVWEHKVVTILLVSLVALPLIEIFGTELYIIRYPLAKV